MSPQPTPPNPLTERLRQKIAGKQGWDTLCLPVGEIRLIADDLDRSSRLRGQLWPSLGRPEGGGLDVELIDAVADLADHRDQLRVEREAHEASLARVTAERDQARQQRDEAEAGQLQALRTVEKLVIQRAAALAYLDECDNGMGSVRGDEVRRRLGVTTDAG